MVRESMAGAAGSEFARGFLLSLEGSLSGLVCWDNSFHGFLVDGCGWLKLAEHGGLAPQSAIAD